MRLQPNKEIQGVGEGFEALWRRTGRVFQRGIDFILPPRCALSGQVVSRPGEIIPEEWAKLEFISDPQCRICARPFEFKMDHEMECASCLKDKPEFAQARAALVYNDHSRNIILGFKHADQLHTLPTFMPWVIRAGAPLIEKADVIIPVPLHRWRLLKRRYNQAALMAQYISRQSGTPWGYDILIRKRATKMQGFMTSKERQQNVKGAFEVSLQQHPKIVGKNILLVDDVYTTGATVRECAKTLLSAGGAEVNVLSIAKVVRR